MSSSGEVNVTVRNAEKKDMGAVYELIKELAAFEKFEDQVKIDKKTLEVDGFGTPTPYFGCLVAELPDVGVVGYALFYYCYSTWEGKSLFLEDLYVKPDQRKKGIGKKLFLEVVKRANGENIKRLDFHVLAWNPAIAFYKQMGAVDLSTTEKWSLFRMNQTSMQQICKG